MSHLRHRPSSPRCTAAQAHPRPRGPSPASRLSSGSEPPLKWVVLTCRHPKTGPPPGCRWASSDGLPGSAVFGASHAARFRARPRSPPRGPRLPLRVPFRCGLPSVPAARPMPRRPTPRSPRRSAHAAQPPARGPRHVVPAVVGSAKVGYERFSWPENQI